MIWSSVSHTHKVRNVKANCPLFLLSVTWWLFLEYISSVHLQTESVLRSGILYLTCSRSSVNICWICTTAALLGVLIPRLCLILHSRTFFIMAPVSLTFPARNASGAPHYLHYKTLYLSWWNKSNHHLFQLHLLPTTSCLYLDPNNTEQLIVLFTNCMAFLPCLAQV